MDTECPFVLEVDDEISFKAQTRGCPFQVLDSNTLQESDRQQDSGREECPTPPRLTYSTKPIASLTRTYEDFDIENRRLSEAITPNRATDRSVIEVDKTPVCLKSASISVNKKSKKSKATPSRFLASAYKKAIRLVSTSSRKHAESLPPLSSPSAKIPSPMMGSTFLRGDSSSSIESSHYAASTVLFGDDVTDEDCESLSGPNDTCEGVERNIETTVVSNDTSQNVCDSCDAINGTTPGVDVMKYTLLRDKMQALEEKCLALEKKNISLQEEMTVKQQSHQRASEQSHHTISELNKKLQNSVNEIVSMKASHAEELHSVQASHTKRLNDMFKSQGDSINDMRLKLSAEITEKYEVQLRDEKAISEQLRQELKESTERAEALKENMNTAVADAKRKVYEKVKSQFEEGNKHYVAIKAQLTECKAENVRISNEIDNLRKSLVEVTSALEESRKRQAITEGEMTGIDATVKFIIDTEGEDFKAGSTREENIAIIKEILVSKKQKIATLTNTIETYEAKKMELNEMISSLTKEIGQLERQKDDLSKELASTKKIMADHEVAVDTLTAEREARTVYIADLLKDKSELEAEIECLREENAHVSRNAEEAVALLEKHFLSQT